VREKVFGQLKDFQTLIIQTRDRLIRAELMKIGWTPPSPEAEAAYLESLKFQRR
jgi:hypothetical protein